MGREGLSEEVTFKMSPNDKKETAIIWEKSISDSRSSMNSGSIA
jgi:hypothetical protein